MDPRKVFTPQFVHIYLSRTQDKKNKPSDKIPIKLCEALLIS